MVMFAVAAAAKSEVRAQTPTLSKLCRMCQVKADLYHYLSPCCYTGVSNAIARCSI